MSNVGLSNVGDLSLGFGAGIDGLGDMRLTFGTTPAVGKAKLAREGKVTATLVPLSDTMSYY